MLAVRGLEGQARTGVPGHPDGHPGVSLEDTHPRGPGTEAHLLEESFDLSSEGARPDLPDSPVQPSLPSRPFCPLCPHLVWPSSLLRSQGPRPRLGAVGPGVSLLPTFSAPLRHPRCQVTFSETPPSTPDFSWWHVGSELPAGTWALWAQRLMPPDPVLSPSCPRGRGRGD